MTLFDYLDAEAHKWMLANPNKPLRLRSLEIAQQCRPTIGRSTHVPDTGFGADVATIQARLNVLGAKPVLVVDGINGPQTEAAIKAFQSYHGLTPDGIVGPLTLAALGLTGAPPAPVPTTGTSILAVRGIEKKSDAFKSKLIDVSRSLGINPDWLATVISFETGGTFSSTAQNPYSKATGLIQFIAPTANSLGTSLDALRNMTDVQQLDYVKRYFTDIIHRSMHSLNDVYLAVFMPSQMGKSDDSVAASEGSTAYEQNKEAFDPNGKGYFTVGDITSTIHSVYNAGLARGRVPVAVAVAGGTGLALALIGAGAYFWAKRKGIL